MRALTRATCAPDANIMQKKYEEMIIFVLADTANVRRLVIIDMVPLAAVRLA